MLSHQFRKHIQGLLAGSIIGIFCSTAALAQTVQIINGTGFLPTSLKEGQRLPSGTSEVETDSETILILKREWKITLGKCIEIVVIRNSYYRIMTDSDCRAVGDATVVMRAMDGESVKEIIRMPIYDESKPTGHASGDSDNFSDPSRSDDGPDPSLMLKRLNNDIGKLKQKAQQRPPLLPVNIKACEQAIQGKIAWNYKGSKLWNPANIRSLCGNINIDAPAVCFNKVMHGGINWGGGTKWKYQNAMNLCRNSQNASRTVECFKSVVRKHGGNWQHAINSCRAR